jgi:hypothetical protein
VSATARAQHLPEPQPVDPEALLRDLNEAVESLRACFGQLEKILARQAPDLGALTSVRLKLAGLRLTRGPLVSEVSGLLSGSLTAADEAMVQELRKSHQAMLQIAAGHTGQWTLEAIATNWAGYRRATRELMLRWLAKVEREQRLIYPLVQRSVDDRAGEGA